jgi:hypothetical protein
MRTNKAQFNERRVFIYGMRKDNSAFYQRMKAFNQQITLPRLLSGGIIILTSAILAAGEII